LRLEPWTIQDVLVVTPQPFSDQRGFFVRTSATAAFAEAGIDTTRFVEESQSRSAHRVLRGLHGRRALSEGKLVRCAHGRVFEVILDLRPWSATFLQWDSMVLDDVEHRQVWVPPGLVHGFQVLSPEADICYRMDAVHEPALDLTVAFDDPALGIPWPLASPIVSERDARGPRLADVQPSFDEWFGASPPLA
jgi:dTDP-4-dehydrorhamnose 3,5-epimerase